MVIINMNRNLVKILKNYKAKEIRKILHDRERMMEMLTELGVCSIKVQLPSDLVKAPAHRP